jgi:FixJ family two-component response regulator
MNRQPTYVMGTLALREREVLEHLARGDPNKDIGARLGCAPRTVAFPRYAEFSLRCRARNSARHCAAEASNGKQH